MIHHLWERLSMTDQPKSNGCTFLTRFQWDTPFFLLVMMIFFFYILTIPLTRAIWSEEPFFIWFIFTANKLQSSYNNNELRRVFLIRQIRQEIFSTLYRFCSRSWIYHILVKSTISSLHNFKTNLKIKQNKLYLLLNFDHQTVMIH